MAQIGIVTTAGLNIRIGPGTDFASRGILVQDEQVELLDLQGAWWRVISERFGPGFAHSEFIAVFAQPEPVVEPVEATYTCVDGDTLIGIGIKLNLPFMEIANLNGLVDPFIIRVGQVLLLPRSGLSGIDDDRPPVSAGTIGVLNPLEFAGQTLVTSSSLQGHHIVFRGTCSLDLDVAGARSQGVPVRFNVDAPTGLELRGVVSEIGLACRSQRIEDGGRTVRIAIHSRRPGSSFADTGEWVLYAHLDPVDVNRGDIVAVGGRVGALGPASGPEYSSGCATASHIHIEASNARTALAEQMIIRNDLVLTIG